MSWFFDSDGIVVDVAAVEDVSGVVDLGMRSWTRFDCSGCRHDMIVERDERHGNWAVTGDKLDGWWCPVSLRQNKCAGPLCIHLIGWGHLGLNNPYNHKTLWSNLPWPNPESSNSWFVRCLSMKRGWAKSEARCWVKLKAFLCLLL